MRSTGPGGFVYRPPHAVNYLKAKEWPTAPPPAELPTTAGGMHHISQGIGDTGVGVVPQTLHTIEQGIAA